MPLYTFPNGSVEDLPVGYLGCINDDARYIRSALSMLKRNDTGYDRRWQLVSCMVRRLHSMSWFVNVTVHKEPYIRDYHGVHVIPLPDLAFAAMFKEVAKAYDTAFKAQTERDYLDLLNR